MIAGTLFDSTGFGVGGSILTTSLGFSTGHDDLNRSKLESPVDHQNSKNTCVTFLQQMRGEGAGASSKLYA